MKRSSEDRIPIGIERRLRAALVTELEQLREGVDMSSAAVTHRIMELAEASSLCLELVEISRR